MAIFLGLVGGENAMWAAPFLVEDVEKQGNHLSTAFIGAKSLMHALSRIGRQDVAFRILDIEPFRCRGFSIKHEATSIWERCDLRRLDMSFQDQDTTTQT